MHVREAKDSPEYRAFSWEMVRARKALIALLNVAANDVADAAVITQDGDAPSLDASFAKFISEAGRSIREDISSVVRHNCAGAALQIVYSAFESFVKAIGETPGPNICAGPEFGNVTFAQLLWAGRNAFAHSDEWKQTSFAHRLAKESAKILLAAGFAEPENINVYDLYLKLSGGDADVFIAHVLDTAKDLAQRTPPLPPDPNALKNVAFVILGSILLILVAVMRKPVDGANDAGEPGVVMFSYKVGDQAIAVPIAEGTIANPAAVGNAIRSGAIARLSPDNAQPFVELDTLVESCFTDFASLLTLGYDDRSYAPRLLELATRAEQVKPMFDALPDPVGLLAAQRDLTSLEQCTALVGEILHDSKFTATPFKEIALTADLTIPKSVEHP